MCEGCKKISKNIMKKSQLRHIIRESIKNIVEGPNDCYHGYKIWTPSKNLSGHYYGLPWQGASTQFSCQESNNLLTYLTFDVNPNTIISLKDPGNTEGFKGANCIKYLGTYDTIQFMMNVEHINDQNVLGGPAFSPQIYEFDNIEACVESHKRTRDRIPTHQNY